MSKTSYDRVYVGEQILPQHMQAAIIVRFMKTNELKSFWDSYKDARMRQKSIQPPTEQQYKLARLRKKMTNKNVATQENVKVFEVLRAVNKVAIWEYLNS
jgi:hypothetical protein